MKKTQMIHSPRTFKLGLGLILAAGLVSMPVLTGASERDDADPAAKTQPSKTSVQLETKSKSASKKMASAETKRRLANAKKPATEGRKSSAENRALERARLAQLESEAKKIAARLTPTQKTKLLALLNDAAAAELTRIDGIGESRSAAIEEARPIKAVEDLQKVKGVGPKTYADLVDHGRSLTRSKSKSKSQSRSSSSKK